MIHGSALHAVHSAKPTLFREMERCNRARCADPRLLTEHVHPQIYSQGHERITTPVPLSLAGMGGGGDVLRRTPSWHPSAPQVRNLFTFRNLSSFSSYLFFCVGRTLCISVVSHLAMSNPSHIANFQSQSHQFVSSLFPLPPLLLHRQSLQVWVPPHLQGGGGHHTTLMRVSSGGEWRPALPTTDMHMVDSYGFAPARQDLFDQGMGPMTSPRAGRRAGVATQGMAAGQGIGGSMTPRKNLSLRTGALSSVVESAGMLGLPDDPSRMHQPMHYADPLSSNSSSAAARPVNKELVRVGTPMVRERTPTMASGPGGHGSPKLGMMKRAISGRSLVKPVYEDVATNAEEGSSPVKSEEGLPVWLRSDKDGTDGGSLSTTASSSGQTPLWLRGGGRDSLGSPDSRTSVGGGSDGHGGQLWLSASGKTAGSGSSTYEYDTQRPVTGKAFSTFGQARRRGGGDGGGGETTDPVGGSSGGTNVLLC